MDEKYNDFDKLTYGLTNDKKLFEIEKLERKAKMKENLTRAKRGGDVTVVKDYNAYKNSKNHQDTQNKNNKEPSKRKNEDDEERVMEELEKEL